MGKNNNKHDGVIKTTAHVSAKSAVPQAHRILQYVSAEKKKVGVVSLLFLVIVGLAVFGWFYANRQVPEESRIESEETVIKSEYEELVRQGPPKTAVPEEVTAYYERLATRAADTGRYNDAVVAYEKRKQISPKSMDYLDYLALAKYYCEVRDAAKAEEAFGLSESILPAQDDFNTGYYRSTMIEEIKFARAECAS